MQKLLSRVVAIGAMTAFGGNFVRANLEGSMRALSGSVTVVARIGGGLSVTFDLTATGKYPPPQEPRHRYEPMTV